MHSPDGPVENERANAGRQPYESPVLRTYGSVAALTQTVGMNGTTADGGGGGMSKTS